VRGFGDKVEKRKNGWVARSPRKNKKFCRGAVKKKIAEKIKKKQPAAEAALVILKERIKIHREKGKKWKRDRPPPTRTFDRGPHPKDWKD
jgi:hypothetical protein